MQQLHWFCLCPKTEHHELGLPQNAGNLYYLLLNCMFLAIRTTTVKPEHFVVIKGKNSESSILLPANEVTKSIWFYKRKSERNLRCLKHWRWQNCPVGHWIIKSRLCSWLNINYHIISFTNWLYLYILLLSLFILLSFLLLVLFPSLSLSLGSSSNFHFSPFTPFLVPSFYSSPSSFLGIFHCFPSSLYSSPSFSLSSSVSFLFVS